MIVFILHIPNIGYFLYTFDKVKIAQKMSEKDITNVLNVWQLENNIQKPVKTSLIVDIIEQMANLFSAGSYYYYIINFENLRIEYVSDSIINVLGITPQEFTVPKVFELLHPEDLSKMHLKESMAINFLLNKITIDKMIHYKVVYLMRFKHINGGYKNILHQARVLDISDDGKIQKVLGIHTDVSYLNLPIDHKISFISSEFPSHFAILKDDKFDFVNSNFKNCFTIREKEILKKLSEGNDFNEIAKQLFVSPHTINTHKKNILEKSGCKNTTELIAKCIREGII